MFDRLAGIIMLTADTPDEETKYWRTKVACNQFDANAYLAGFKQVFIKEASCDTYVASSELGVYLGAMLLDGIKSCK